MKNRLGLLFLTLLLFCSGTGIGQQSKQQLARWLKQFPDADANGDGRLTIEEADTYRRNRQKTRGKKGKIASGSRLAQDVDPGWLAERFPKHAMCYRSPREIAAIYAKTKKNNRGAVTSYPKPTDGSLRIVGTGAVSQEKDRRTLILLLMTRMTNSELVLGRLFASLLEVFVMVAYRS